jgi:hypothetical protein
MKKNTTLLLITVAMLSTSPLGHAAQHENDRSSANEAKQEVADAAEGIKDYSVAKRDEAVKKAKEALASLDARIDALQERIDDNWQNMSEAAREDARATLKALRQQRLLVAEWYGGLKNSSTEAWDHMKKGFSDAYQSLRGSWQKAEKEFEKDTK